jgi:hypothetical protein
MDLDSIFQILPVFTLSNSTVDLRDHLEVTAYVKSQLQLAVESLHERISLKTLKL